MVDQSDDVTRSALEKAAKELQVRLPSKQDFKGHRLSQSEKKESAGQVAPKSADAW